MKTVLSLVVFVAIAALTFAETDDGSTVAGTVESSTSQASSVSTDTTTSGSTVAVTVESSTAQASSITTTTDGTTSGSTVAATVESSTPQASSVTTTTDGTTSGSTVAVTVESSTSAAPNDNKTNNKTETDYKNEIIEGLHLAAKGAVGEAKKELENLLAFITKLIKKTDNFIKGVKDLLQNIFSEVKDVIGELEKKIIDELNNKLVDIIKKAKSVVDLNKEIYNIIIKVLDDNLDLSIKALKDSKEQFSIKLKDFIKLWSSDENNADSSEASATSAGSSEEGNVESSTLQPSKDEQTAGQQIISGGGKLVAGAKDIAQGTVGAIGTGVQEAEKKLETLIDIHKTLAADMDLKMLMMEDGTPKGKCYCSCNLNSQPVFLEINPSNLPAVYAIE